MSRKSGQSLGLALPRLGSRVRIPSPAPNKSLKNQGQRCIFDGDVRASISLNEPGTVPSSLADLGKRRAKRSRNIPDGPPKQTPPRRQPSTGPTRKAGQLGGPVPQPSARWMLLGSQIRLRSLFPPSSLTHPVNERKRCPQAEVRGSNHIACADDFKTIAVFRVRQLLRQSAELLRNTFYPRSCRRGVAHVR
jgi:hypothetical protein